MTRRPLLFAVLGIALLAATLPVRPLRIVYNASASAPQGWWLISPASQPRAGDYVLAELPPPVAALAAERGYLPRGVPILKRIAARGGQRVCVVKRQVSIDGIPLARALTHDREQRALPIWEHCRALGDDELFVFNPQRAGSFDSRYFGPLRRADLRGVAQPLWTWGPP